MCGWSPNRSASPAISASKASSAKRLEAALAIDLVVAWRIFDLAKLGRVTPEVLPCTVFFEDDERRALCLRVNPTTELPQNPPSLRQATIMLAFLGGFLGRTCDGEPGTQTLWLGLQRLDDLTHMYRVVTATTGPPGVQRRYGA